MDEDVPLAHVLIFSLTNCMKQLIFFILLMLSFTACHDKGRVVEPKGGPAHLMLLEPDCNFGIVTERSGIVEKEVPLINDGGETLVIKDIRPSCHCTTVECSQEPIEPGHYTPLKIRLNMADLSTGEFVREIEIIPESGSITTLRLTGEKI